MNVTKLFFLIIFCLSFNSIFSMFHNEEHARQDANPISRLYQKDFFTDLKYELEETYVKNKALDWLSALVRQLKGQIIPKEYQPNIYLEKLIIETYTDQPQKMMFSQKDALFAYVDSSNIMHLFTIPKFAKSSMSYAEPNTQEIIVDCDDILILDPRRAPIRFTTEGLTLIRQPRADMTAYSYSGKWIAFYTCTNEENGKGFISVAEKLTSAEKVILILVLTGICKVGHQENINNRLIHRLMYYIPMLSDVWDTLTTIEQNSLAACLNFDSSAILRGW